MRVTFALPIWLAIPYMVGIVIFVILGIMVFIIVKLVWLLYIGARHCYHWLFPET